MEGARQLGFAIALLVAVAAAPAVAQPARVQAIVSRPGPGRDIARTNDAVRGAAERALARCEPVAREAQPFDSQYFSLVVDATGRVRRVRRPALPTHERDLTTYPATMRPVDRAVRRRVAAWIACAARGLRTLHFPAGPAGEIEVMVRWTAPGPPQGLVGMMRSGE